MRGRGLALLALFTVGNVSVARALAPEPGGSPPAQEPRPSADGPCRELRRRQLQGPAGAAAMGLLIEVQADQVARMFLDSLAQRPEVGDRWREGNRYWEEAYALLQPQVLDLLRAVAEREMERGVAGVRGRDAETCRKYLALVETAHGKLISRALGATEMLKMLQDYQGAFPVPARLEGRLVAVKRLLQREIALVTGPEAAREPTLYEATERKMRLYEKRITGPIDHSSDGETSGEGVALGAALMDRNREKLTAILRAFIESERR